MEERGDLWLIIALVGVALLLAFCAWGVHFTPDMSEPADELLKMLGSLMLCGGPILLLIAGFCFIIGM